MSHVFSSDLQRARKTAEALINAQAQSAVSEVNLLPRKEPFTLIEDRRLREQDFGFYEGKPFYARELGSPKSGKENHRSQHLDDPGFKDVESKDSLRRRADDFVHGHLVPLLCKDDNASSTLNIAIFSHGIILTHLWRSVLCLFGQSSVSLAPGISIGGVGSTSLEHLGGWSNTGYLELEILPEARTTSQASKALTKDALAEDPDLSTKDENAAVLSVHPKLRLRILTINGKDHLRALKRTRGVGSAAHDEGQKKIDNFFKKPKQC